MEFGYSSQETNPQLSFSLIHELRVRNNKKNDPFCEKRH